MSSATGTNKGRKAPWENRERHYCEVCNAWMGSDRQSILVHENGRKHQENVERANQARRQEKLQQDKNAKLLQQSLQQMESSARQSLSQDLGYFAHNIHAAAPVPLAAGGPTRVTTTIAPPPPPPSRSSKSSDEDKKQKQEWEAHKKRRQEEKAKKRQQQEGDDGDEQESEQHNKRQKLSIAPNEGHYTHDNKIYLEGPTFGDVLEEDMPIQIWTGSNLANLGEKRLLDRHHYWKDGIVAAVRQRPSATTYAECMVVDVAYLQSSDDQEETLEKSIPLHRVRIILGADESIPETLEEARLLAVGGEEIVTEQKKESLNENTGLSSWSTVSIKRTTVRQELKEERARLRQKRKEAIEEAERQKKEAEAHKMEEAKVANADDSALGAYDVWSRTKEGYKGVNIHGEAKVEVHEMGKKLAEGKAVAFKKSAFKAKKKKQNRRTTSADDD